MPVNSIDHLIRHLPLRWQTILRLRYVHQVKAATVGRSLGVSERRIGQITKKAINRLRLVLC